ncbi:hypothetical protein ABW19_dt0208283 [Dactylella cylindrospora]|nr:hypothetical protein ABW19_dt0208283 [Dactylella cylindrospora]
MAAKIADNPRSHEEYSVGWICALPKEQAVAISMLDEIHPDLPKSANDSNCYTLGPIGLHNVVITCLPKDWVGTSQAAKAAAQMTNTFPSIKVGLMVGIGGGIPPNVKLGDVVISTEWTQWDFGKTKDGRFEHIDKRYYPPDALLSAISKFESEHQRARTRIPEYLQQVTVEYPYFTSQYGTTTNVPVRYGLIASGNQVIKDASLRDRINKDLGGRVLCIEMEAAGLIGFPAAIIRGICDYANSEKNDDWQEYCAVVAAACAKQLLGYVQPTELDKERRGKEILNKG